MTETMVYVGSNEQLKGKTALVQQLDDIPGVVLAQFDDVSLGEMAFGWHEFLSKDFQEIG